MLLYTCFRFFRSHLSDVSHGSGAVQGSFRATLSEASVFVHVVLRPGWVEMFPPTTTGFFFGANLDYLDFSDGIFDL